MGFGVVVFWCRGNGIRADPDGWFVSAREFLYGFDSADVIDSTVVYLREFFVWYRYILEHGADGGCAAVVRFERCLIVQRLVLPEIFQRLVRKDRRRFSVTTYGVVHRPVVDS